MKVSSTLLFLAMLAVCGSAMADDAKPDGQWRGNGGAALSVSSGNTHGTSLNLTADATRLTANDKLAISGQMLGSRSESSGVATTTANQWNAGTRYDYNLSPIIFGFGGLDLGHDQLKQLSLRSVVSGGLGYHVIKASDDRFDVFGGASYRADRYSGSGVSINNETKTSLNAVELLLGEESQHKLSESTSFKQKLVISPNLSSAKGMRATFDAGLLVSMSKTLSLNLTLQDRYDSLSQAPLKKNDLLFFTGVNVKFGE
jgi:putative salt-induced outer membrane protein